MMELEEKEKHTEERISIVGSFIIHVLVFVLFIIVSVEVQTEIPEYSVVDLADITALEEEIPEPVVQEEEPQPAQTQPEKELVELPKRNFTDLEKPEVPFRTNEKILAEDEKITAGEKITPSEELQREPVRKIEDLMPQEKKETSLENLGVGERFSDPNLEQRPQAPPINRERYSIEWMAGTRVKVSGEVPRYPEGINKEVTIKIRFFVLPDGTVGDMIPVEKGERILEDICMRALKQWRFNKLESLAPQVRQQGVITFRFELR